MDNSKQTRLRIFDTTLRDGDQTAGFPFSAEEKLAFAGQLDAYGVDCIEVGLPCSSPADFDCCRRIASCGLHADIAVMSRCLRDDIIHSAQVFTEAHCGRRIIHLSVPVSEILIHARFGTDTDSDTDKICHIIEDSVRFAVPLADIVELEFEDATRADPFFLAGCCRLAIESGAGVINIADTAGCLMPKDMGKLVCLLKDSVPYFFAGTAVLGVHCHNDSGLALASALCAVRNGADQIDVTAGSVGKRCGNVLLEELAYVLESRPDICRVRTHLKPERTGDLCHLLFS